MLTGRSVPMTPEERAAKKRADALALARQQLASGIAPGLPGGLPVFDITNATGTGAVVTFTCRQSFQRGDLVRVMNMNPPVYNMNFALVMDARPHEFRVVSGVTGTFVPTPAFTRAGVAVPMPNTVYRITNVVGTGETNAYVDAGGQLVPPTTGSVTVTCENALVVSSVVSIVGVIPQVFNVDSAVVVKAPLNDPLAVRNRAPRHGALRQGRRGRGAGHGPRRRRLRAALHS
jgi:hypothetical protein